MSSQWSDFFNGLTRKLANSPSPRDLALMVAFPLAYFVAGVLGLKLEALPPGAAAIWIPAGIALAALVLLGFRRWPAIFAGCVLLNIWESGPVLSTLTIAIGNTLAALAGAYLVNKYAHGAKAFDTAQDVFRFVLFGCILTTSISATAGILSFFLDGRASGAQFGYLWLTWWVADASGALLIAPFLIVLFSRSHHRLDHRELLELTTLILGLLLVALLAFGPLSPSLNKSNFFRAWMCVPFLIWAGFRFCQLEAAGLLLVLFGTAIWGTMHGFGYFVTQDLNAALLNLDVFLGVIGTMTLAVAAMVAERRGIEASLIGIQSLLQGAVEGRDRDLASVVETLHSEVLERNHAENALRASHDRFRLLMDRIPVVFWLLDTIAERILYVSPAYETVWGRTCDSLYADAHSWIDSVHPQDHDIALTFFDRNSKSDRFEEQYRIVRPDGSVRMIWDRGFVIRDEAGRICRIAGLASDITEKKGSEGLSAARGERL